jgi:hypothetical protein
MTISLSELEALVHKTISLYNKLKSPEAVAKTVKVTLETVTIEFSGSFCYDCGGILNYVDDFAHDFKVFVDYVELKVGQTRQINPRIFQVDYAVKSRRK